MRIANTNGSTRVQIITVRIKVKIITNAIFADRGNTNWINKEGDYKLKKYESDNLYPDPLNPELNDPKSPVWKQGGRVHNWQNYIGERTRDIWNSFADQMKIVLALDAHDSAMGEEWD